MERSQVESSKVLIIASMHRSGSSLTASLLQSTGLHIGRRLMQPNEGNIKGYFENNDFYNFHKRVLKSQGIHEDGWTLQESIDVEESFVEQAKEIISRNSISAIWGWKEPRTTLFLDFWAELIPDAKFLLIYRAPWEVADSMYRRTYYDLFQTQPELAVKIWLHYNQKILNFYNKFSPRCFLANLETIVKNPAFYTQAINQKFQVNLGLPASDIYDASLLQTQAVDSHRASLINHYYPEAIALYKELEARAWQLTDTPDTSWQEKLKSSPYRVWAFQDWVKVGNLQGENQKLQEKLGQTQSQLQETEEKLGQTQAQLHQTQEKLGQTQSQLHQTQEELGHTQSQLHQTQEELGHTHSQLHQTQEKLGQTQDKLGQTQSQLNHTQEKLGQSQSQLHQTQEELGQTQSQLHHTQEELERSQSQLHQTQEELDCSQSQLHQTEEVLEQSQAQLHETETVLEEAMTQLHQRTEELERSQSQLHQNEEVLEQSQAQLHETETVLEEAVTKLRQKTEELERAQSQLNRTQAQLERSQFQLHQTQEELERLQFEQNAMEQTDEPKQLKYQLLLRDAWLGYRQGDMTQMRRSLQESMKFTPFSRTETVSHWSEMFAQFSEQGGERLDIYALTNSPEWKQSLARAIGRFNKVETKLPNLNTTSSSKIEKISENQPIENPEETLRFNVDRCLIIPPARLSINGWVDPRPEVGIECVEVRLDSQLIQRCKLFILRPDVAQGLGDERFLTSGWSCTYDFPGRTIPLDAILTIKAIASNATERLLCSKTLESLSLKSKTP